MKKVMITATLIFLSCIVSQSYALGVSPGRWTSVLPEHVVGDSIQEKTVTLYQDGPFSEVRLLNPDGLNASFTSNLPTGTSLANENTLVVDWSQVGTNTLTLTYNVSISDGWTAPDGPGTRCILDGLVHQQLADPSQAGIIPILGVIQQFSIVQTYEPRVCIEDLSSSVAIGQSATVVMQLEDKNYKWWGVGSNHQWFSYEVDWDGDGLVDESGTTTFDEGPSSTISGIVSVWTSGIQTSTLALEHIYDTPGSYAASVTIAGLPGDGDLGFSDETVNVVLPIEVVPEPTTLCLLGLGVLLIKKRFV